MEGLYAWRPLLWTRGLIDHELDVTADMGSRKMVIGRRTVCVFLLSTTLFLGLAGCQTLRQVAALRLVDFALDRVTQPRLAGVDVSRIRSYEDLSTTAVLRLAAAATRGELPFDFVLHVQGRNPEENAVTARLVEMEWTLFLEDRETVSGSFQEEMLLPPGQVTDIPIPIRVDLAEFFGENLQNLVQLALSVAGDGGQPTNVRLEAVPKIRTPLGAIRYPRPITIIARDVGG